MPDLWELCYRYGLLTPKVLTFVLILVLIPMSVPLLELDALVLVVAAVSAAGRCSVLEPP